MPASTRRDSRHEVQSPPHDPRVQKCFYCETFMDNGGGCSVTHILHKGVWKARVPNDSGKDCPDCGAGHGRLHHYICNVAKCPACGGQEVYCHCVTDALRGAKHI